MTDDPAKGVTRSDETERDSGRTRRPIVTGRLIIDAGAAPFQDGTAHVQLEDVSLADADAEILAESIIHPVSHAPGDPARATIVPFALSIYSNVPAIDPRHHYAVRAWVKPGEDDQSGSRNLHSDRSYRVLTRGFGDTVDITVGGSP